MTFLNMYSTLIHKSEIFWNNVAAFNSYPGKLIMLLKCWNDWLSRSLRTNVFQNEKKNAFLYMHYTNKTLFQTFWYIFGSWELKSSREYIPTACVKFKGCHSCLNTSKMPSIVYCCLSLKSNVFDKCIRWKRELFLINLNLNYKYDLLLDIYYF